MDQAVQIRLYEISLLILLNTPGTQRSSAFDRLFILDGFDYHQVRLQDSTTHRSRPLSVLSLAQAQDQIAEHLEALFTGGYPDYAVTAKNFLRTQTPKLLKESER